MAAGLGYGRYFLCTLVCRTQFSGANTGYCDFSVLLTSDFSRHASESDSPDPQTAPRSPNHGGSTARGGGLGRGEGDSQWEAEEVERRRPLRSRPRLALLRVVPRRACPSNRAVLVVRLLHLPPPWLVQARRWLRPRRPSPLRALLGPWPEGEGGTRPRGGAMRSAMPPVSRAPTISPLP